MYQKQQSELFPEGIDISIGDFMGNISNTKNLLKSRKPLFEAGILAGKLYPRIDILSPAAEEEWDIVEVKSSTKVKDVHIDLRESFGGDSITRLPSLLVLQTEV